MSFDWLIDWLGNQMLFDWLIDWFGKPDVVRLIDWLIDWLKIKIFPGLPLEGEIFPGWFGASTAADAFSHDGQL